MEDRTKDIMERTEIAYREAFSKLATSDRCLTIGERLVHINRTRLKWRIVIVEGNRMERVLFDGTYKRDRININDVPDKLLDRYPKRTTICDLKGVTKTIYFEL